ncbi:MAG TPA: right-handed parallel beta-helix repeat-containing protein, partial [Sphingomonas sp.]
MRPFVLALALAAPAAAQQAAPFTVEGRGFRTLGEALMENRGRDFTVMIAPGVYRECAVQQAGRVTFRAAQPGTVVFDGVACEDKAAFVLRGDGS